MVYLRMTNEATVVDEVLDELMGILDDEVHSKCDYGTYLRLHDLAATLAEFADINRTVISELSES